MTKINDYDEKMEIPKDVFLNGKKFKGNMGFVNGYNGYESTPEDGLLVAFDNKGQQAGKITDKNGFQIRSKARRSNII